MEFRVLGPSEGVEQERPLPLGGVKQRSSSADDLEAFERLRAAGRPRAALALWRGPPDADPVLVRRGASIRSPVATRFTWSMP